MNAHTCTLVLIIYIGILLHCNAAFSQSFRSCNDLLKEDENSIINELGLNTVNTRLQADRGDRDQFGDTGVFVSALMAAQSQTDMTRILLERYPELNWLTGAVDATPEGQVAAGQVAAGQVAAGQAAAGQVAAIRDKSPSETFFGEKHIEFDRSVTGIFLLKWILVGDYEAFTAPQKGAAKLTRENFAHLKEYTESILNTQESIDAMIAYMVINDLGKIRAIVDEVQNRTGLRDVDHDNILLVALESHPEISPSFQRLNSERQRVMIRGLQARFNIGQFLQGENVPASLTGLRGLDKESLDFYLLHAIADIGGAAGHVTSNGSIVMSNPTYEGFKTGVRAIEGFNFGKTEVEVYNNFLMEKGSPFGLEVSEQKDRVIIRLISMLRASDSETVELIQQVFDSLPINVQVVLLKEMNINGFEDGYASLLYYSPAALANLISLHLLQKDSNPDNHFQLGLEKGLITLAEIYQHARIMLKGREGSGVFTVMVSAIAEAAKTPGLLDESRIELKPIEEDAEALILSRNPIDSSVFSQLNSLTEIVGQRVGVVGIGGGSDGVQAAQLGLLLHQSGGKDVPFVISVRTVKTESQGVQHLSGTESQGVQHLSGTESQGVQHLSGEARKIQNHGGEITDGVFNVLSQSQGSGRFLENIPASEVNMYLVIDNLDGTLTQKIQAVIDYEGGVDTVIGVDTGGDVLYPMGGSSDIDKSKSTPDQDLRVLSSLSRLNDVNLLSGIIATGVDTPDNAQFILQRARANYYQLSDQEIDAVLSRYEAWDMTGENNNRFGKTPLTWQLALTGQRGLQVINLPTRVVVDGSNPWNPFVRVDDSMAGIFFMNINNHVDAIRNF